VRREKRGGKVVTVIAGLDPAASDLPALLKQFRAALGAGGTIKDGAIELQGDHSEAIVKRLRAMGYPAKTAGG
jgi:translation initiation factor 1